MKKFRLQDDTNPFGKRRRKGARGEEQEHKENTERWLEGAERAVIKDNDKESRCEWYRSLSVVKQRKQPPAKVAVCTEFLLKNLETSNFICKAEFKGGKKVLCC